MSKIITKYCCYNNYYPKIITTYCYHNNCTTTLLSCYHFKMLKSTMPMYMPNILNTNYHNIDFENYS